MARILFDLPERFSFTTRVAGLYQPRQLRRPSGQRPAAEPGVRGAHARFFQSLGYTEGDVAGLAIVVGDMLAQYKSEAFHGETLRVQMTPRTSTATAATWCSA